MSNKGVIAPRLPAPPAEYDAIYMNSLLNALRLYFNGLDTNGPIVVSTERNGSDISAALSCAKVGVTGSAATISLPTQADLANLRSGDIYYDTSGGVATSYPLRIKA